MTMHTQSQTQATPAGVDSAVPGSVLMNVGGALALILMIIAVCAWVARRTGFAQRLPKGNQILSVVASHSMGQRERVVVIDMEGKRLLLGVTPTQINCLATFDKPSEEDAVRVAPAAGDFQSTLLNLLKKRKTESME
ncbi:flagellar biosynthetic protein FliO [Enterobacteriaceae bacterium Kacie_13]|nr:flagellar biosynthetic protein FliO [Enterobacteriaceae bacterium Kacie_13]